jgi:hypothetical protein
MKAAFKVRWFLWGTALLMAVLFHAGPVQGVTNEFFFIWQSTNLITTNVTSDTIGTEGYSFNLTRDKLFTGGVGMTNPIGRNLRVLWPDGLEAQAITTGPNPGGAKIIIKRLDGAKFDIKTFSFQLLANTAGAGAALEVMPQLDGEDALPDPIMYNATGYYGQRFTNTTPALTNYDTYKMSLYVDFALLNLTVVDPSPPVPDLYLFQVDANTLQLSWTTNSDGYVLQSTTDLYAPWSPVTNDIINDGEFFSVQVDLSGGKRFYQLQK